MKKELIVIFLVTFIILSFLIVRGFIPENQLTGFQPTLPPSMIRPSFNPSPDLQFRSELPENALTGSKLNVTQTCKPYTGSINQISYVRDSDEAYLGVITEFNIRSMRIQVNDYLYDRQIDKFVYHNDLKTSRYYDKNCNEILPGKIQVGDRAIIYTSTNSSSYSTADYVQIITI